MTGLYWKGTKMNTTKLTKWLLVTGFAIAAPLAVGFNPRASAAAPEAVTIYNTKCAICHGADGSGNTANGRKLKVRDLRCPEVQKMSDKQLYDIISKGKDKMPAYEATIGKETVTKMVSYTRELAKK